MELRQLRYFLAVAEELHFGRAAKKVHISQPPLSQQILLLEEDLRVKLFHRTKRKVELTEAGRVFAGEARQILKQVDQAAGLAVEANRGKVNRIVVGYSPANTNIVVKILKMFSERNPRVQILIKGLITPKQVEDLRNGIIDVGFVTLPIESEGLSVETILRERLVVALPKKHPLAKRSTVPLRALANETMIIFPLQLSSGRYEIIAEMCRRAGFSLHVVHEVENIHTMLELVGAGFGVSLMRASVQDVAGKEVVFRELQHSPIVETAIAYKRGNPSAVLPALIEAAKTIVNPRTLRKRMLS